MYIATVSVDDAALYVWPDAGEHLVDIGTMCARDPTSPFCEAREWAESRRCRRARRFLTATMSKIVASGRNRGYIERFQS